MTDELMTLDQVAEALSVSIHTVREWRRKRLIEVIKLPSGSIRVRRATLMAMLEAGVEPARDAPSLETRKGQ